MGDNKEQTDIQSLLAQKDTTKLSSFLKEQISDYKNSEMFKKYLDFVAKCPKYSSRNIRMLQKQKPNIGHVGTFTKWKEQGYHIKKANMAIKSSCQTLDLNTKMANQFLTKKGIKFRNLKDLV
ncbi:Uncharacterised protein [Enterococcus faecalis]|uniref:ArdC-like ssDNA-binding domain-containing protein n=1 Tax=Enterococcus faecalis TaxID=1351 RepID=UPI0010F3FCD3|nr:ArdC-like ssDNA-binding domain-containing protein [Enterococcus faecalis]VTS80180.1 Uncharacterised protein [Enterococcus faecalis]